MERVVKFRGRNYDGTWMYGYLMPTPKPQIHPNNKYSISVSPQALTSVDKALYEVETNTVGQFTGLHDKNGKEIYEGDVITQYLVFQNGKHYECKARGGQVVFDKLWGFVLLSESRLYHLFGDGLTQEVQGNIHDNPNLLNNAND